MQLGGFIARLLGPSLKNVLKPLTKSVLTPLGLTAAAAAAADTGIYEKIHESDLTKLIISKLVMEDIMKIVKSLEDSGLLRNAKQLKMKQRSKRVNSLACY